jgi:hypothetical protein
MVPSLNGLVGLLLLGAWADPDPHSLVARLGSARYAERESASSALEKLGQEAFPALRAARKDPDPEVKNRAEVLLDAIERSMLTRAVTIDLAAGRQDASEVIARLSKAEGVAFQVGEPPDRDGKSRTFTLRSPLTLTFWQSLDRLGLSLQWDQDTDFGRPITRRPPTARLVTSSDPPRTPTSDYGPFRLIARGASVGREASPFEPGFRGAGIFPPQQPRARHERAVELSIPVEVLIEPRLTLRSLGDVRILEAVDNEGHALQPTLRSQTDSNAFTATTEAASSSLTFALRLQPPSPRSKSIRTIRGLVSAEIEARRLDPATLALNGPSPIDQRPLLCSGSTVFIRGLSNVGNNPRNGYVLELTVRPEDWPSRALRQGGGRRMMMQLSSMDFSSVWQCLEVVDAQGVPFRLNSPRPIGPDADGVRLNVNLTPRDGSTGPPSELRVFGQIQTQVEVPFEFHDLKLP